MPGREQATLSPLRDKSAASLARATGPPPCTHLCPHRNRDARQYRCRPGNFERVRQLSYSGAGRSPAAPRLATWLWCRVPLYSSPHHSESIPCAFISPSSRLWHCWVLHHSHRPPSSPRRGRRARPRACAMEPRRAAQAPPRNRVIGRSCSPTGGTTASRTARISTTRARRSTKTASGNAHVDTGGSDGPSSRRRNVGA